MDNRDRFVVRDGWLRKLHHRGQMAPNGGIKYNPVGIFGKWRRPYRGRAWPVQIRRPGPNQNRDAIRNDGLPDDNFRRPDDAARARRLQARV